MLKANKAASISDSAGFRRMFAPDWLSLGVFFPIEAFERDEPKVRDQARLARRAEELGFAGLWTRDVPLLDPNFGDLGQVYDPWVWLGWIAAHTSAIALATGSIILPLRHPVHTAKAFGLLPLHGQIDGRPLPGSRQVVQDVRHGAPWTSLPHSIWSIAYSLPMSAFDPKRTLR